MSIGLKSRDGEEHAGKREEEGSSSSRFGPRGDSSQEMEPRRNGINERWSREEPKPPRDTQRVRDEAIPPLMMGGQVSNQQGGINQPHSTGEVRAGSFHPRSIQPPKEIGSVIVPAGVSHSDSPVTAGNHTHARGYHDNSQQPQAPPAHHNTRPPAPSHALPFNQPTTNMNQPAPMRIPKPHANPIQTTLVPAPVTTAAPATPVQGDMANFDPVQATQVAMQQLQMTFDPALFTQYQTYYQQYYLQYYQQLKSQWKGQTS